MRSVFFFCDLIPNKMESKLYNRGVHKYRCIPLRRFWETRSLLSLLFGKISTKIVVYLCGAPKVSGRWGYLAPKALPKNVPKTHPRRNVDFSPIFYWFWEPFWWYLYVFGMPFGAFSVLALLVLSSISLSTALLQVASVRGVRRWRSASEIMTLGIPFCIDFSDFFENRESMKKRRV